MVQHVAQRISEPAITVDQSARMPRQRLLFARALWWVRQALLRAGTELAAAGRLVTVADVFHLAIPTVERALTGATGDLAAEAREGRRRWATQRRQRPPLSVDRGVPTWGPPAVGRVIRGVGVGGVTDGVVCRVDRAEDLLETDLRGVVVVCPTVLPALAIALPQVAALVTDHGGVLSHAACLARELGLPTVVGTRVATQVLRSGDRVEVDGPRGRVVLVQAAAHGDNGAPGAEGAADAGGAGESTIRR